MTNSSQDGGSRLLQAIEVIAISPEDAIAIADQYVVQSKQLLRGGPLCVRLSVSCSD